MLVSQNLLQNSATADICIHGYMDSLRVLRDVYERDSARKQRR